MHSGLDEQRSAFPGDTYTDIAYCRGVPSEYIARRSLARCCEAAAPEVVFALTGALREAAARAACVSTRLGEELSCLDPQALLHE